MTLQELRGKLYEQGFLKASVESKAVTAAYGILNGCDYEAMDIWKNEKYLKSVKADIKELEGHRNHTVRTIEWRERECKEYQERLKKETQKVEQYISAFYESIEKCETAEARDAMRIAQMYVNTVDVDTKYDNTAFIIGLSAILTGKTIEPIDELKKINKKLQVPSFGRL